MERRLFSLNGPLPWDLPARPTDSSNPSPRPRSQAGLSHASAAGQAQRDVWVGLAATGRKLHGPQVVNHEAGQMPGPELGQPFPSACPVLPGQPSANSSPALAAGLGSVLGRSPSMLLLLPAFPVPLTHLPSSLCALPSSPGLERRTLGKPRQVGAGRGRAPPGAPASPKQPAGQPRKEQHPVRGRNGLWNGTAAHGGGSLPTAARATPLLQN